MKKSPQAFRTISEVAKALDVPAHVLRFWESRFSQIKPVKRGGGRRYYRPEDVDLIRGIRNLLYTEGLTIKGAQKVLRDKGTRHVIAIGQGEDARIAEADALWDEPGASEVATPGPDAPTSPPPPPEPVRPAPQAARDPRQTSLFDTPRETPPEKNLFAAPPADPVAVPASAQDTGASANAPQTDPSDTHAAPGPAPATLTQPVSPPPATGVEQNPRDTLDQDALKKVFGKLQALRASMDDD